MIPEKALEEHIESIAFAIDPFSSTNSLVTAIANYQSKYSGNIYFKTDITLMDVEQTKAFIEYLDTLFATIETQIHGSGNIRFYLFIYSDNEMEHAALNIKNCINLGPFDEVAVDDIKNWLAEN